MGSLETMCLWCRFAVRKTILHQSKAARQPAAWHRLMGQTRSVSQKARSSGRPRRMTLSPNLGKSTTVRVQRAQGKKVPSRKLVPTHGMNRQEAGIRRVMERKGDRQHAKIPRADSKFKNQRSGKRRGDKKRTGFHALKMQQALTAVPYSERTRITAKIASKDSFDNFALLDSVKQAIREDVLTGLKLQEPTPVQRLAIPALLGSESRRQRKKVVETSKTSMQQHMIAAETGSGKTLAYLAPVLDSLKRAEMQRDYKDMHAQADSDDSPSPTTSQMSLPTPSDGSNLPTVPHESAGRPRAIVLLPTSELVDQVGAVAKTMSHKVKFRTGIVSAAYRANVIRNRLFSPLGIDLLVITPQLLAALAEDEPNILSRVTHLVIDEADSLLDRSFAPSTLAIVDKSTPSLQQLILCSATIPRSLETFVAGRFPDITRTVTPKLHAIPRHVQLGVIDVDKQPFMGNKMLACADAIWSIGKAEQEKSTGATSLHEPTYIMVFVNQREQTVEVADYLKSKGINAMPFQRDMTDAKTRRQVLSDYTSGKKKPSEQDDSVELTTTNESNQNKSLARDSDRGEPLVRNRRRLANTRVLVATDLGSRGIDTISVRHVILYDVPHTTIDFIHRLGRVGRMGRRGRGLALVGKKDRKDVVREVQDGMYKGQALI